jgi:hypothetical protein
MRYSGNQLQQPQQKENNKMNKLKLKMKMIILSACVCSAWTAQASLIDLGTVTFPLGDDASMQRFHQLSGQLAQQTLLVDAAHGWFNQNQDYYDGWLNGALNGADYFGTDLFGRDTDSANISWNLTGEPHGFFMTMILVEGWVDNEHTYAHFYSVPWDNLFASQNETVSLPDNITIHSIAFCGSNTIPDTGPTLLLATIALMAVLMFKATAKTP